MIDVSSDLRALSSAMAPMRVAARRGKDDVSVYAMHSSPTIEAVDGLNLRHFRHLLRHLSLCVWVPPKHVKHPQSRSDGKMKCAMSKF